MRCIIITLSYFIYIYIYHDISLYELILIISDFIPHANTINVNSNRNLPASQSIAHTNNFPHSLFPNHQTTKSSQHQNHHQCSQMKALASLPLSINIIKTKKREIKKWNEMKWRRGNIYEGKDEEKTIAVARASPSAPPLHCTVVRRYQRPVSAPLSAKWPSSHTNGQHCPARNRPRFLSYAPPFAKLPLPASVLISASPSTLHSTHPHCHQPIDVESLPLFAPSSICVLILKSS